jgi:hypothetical protein
VRCSATPRKGRLGNDAAHLLDVGLCGVRVISPNRSHYRGEYSVRSLGFIREVFCSASPEGVCASIEHKDV